MPKKEINIRETQTRNTFKGVVVSDKGDKTISVEVTTYRKHPLYSKRVIRTKKFLVHDEKNEAKIGDKVIFMVCRPLSARKHMRLVKITEKAKVLA